MLSYVQYGNGKVGYVTTEYRISDDYRMKIKVTVAKEVEGESFETKNVPLTMEERKFVKKLQSNIEKRKRPFKEEIEEKFEDSEIRYNGEVIKDKSLMSQFDLLREIIEANHKEFEPSKIATLYDETCQRLYHKRVS